MATECYAPPQGGRQLAALSNAVVRLHARYYGRGPTRARSHWAGPDAILCIMQDVFDAGERTLIEFGRLDEVRSSRLAFHDGMKTEFASAAEEIVGRKVASFMGQVIANPEYGMAVFIFEPRPAVLY